MEHGLRESTDRTRADLAGSSSYEQTNPLILVIRALWIDGETPDLELDAV